ncbi:hypothetical protein HSRCO_2897 [Halanaeroarchaeum sp. HSR-CO]|uniref:hypothetical protein n=1 Tax=Halanaeroarchaeum sp. HSR-CO TaxID=2866382 RepID=UPI00217ECDFB|nr:hypothetical protein [Halanaeroarchaeum sp. HSR-CO]UWG47790.1 hypothetical protein HSRCO_2897 [Halanaeroarchaeum sp. HSR-CO]
MYYTENNRGKYDHCDSVGQTVTAGIRDEENSETEDYEVIKSGDSISSQPSQDIHTSSPRRPSEYPRQFLIDYAIRQKQREEQSQPNNRSSAEEAKVEQEFDFVVIDYARNALDERGFRAPIKRGYVVGLILAKIRKLKIKPLARHLNRNPETRNRLEPIGGTSHSTINRRKNELSEDHLRIVEDAAQDVLYAVYRRGHDFPESVREAHEDDHCSPICLENKFVDRVSDELE